jgi:Na+/melibiose symporter-like transporter
MDKAWVILSLSLAIIAFNFWRIRRSPHGKQVLADMRREIVTLRTVRTWLIALGGVLSLIMTLLLATVANDGTLGNWVLVAAFLMVDVVFFRALLERWRNRIRA